VPFRGESDHNGVTGEKEGLRSFEKKGEMDRGTIYGKCGKEIPP